MAISSFAKTNECIRQEMSDIIDAIAQLMTAANVSLEIPEDDQRRSRLQGLTCGDGATDRLV